jgi:hypothetical protein
MTAPLQRVGAALLYLLAIPVALRGRGAAARGRGSSRGRIWPLGRGSRRRTRRSPSLWLPPSDSRSAGPISDRPELSANPFEPPAPHAPSGRAGRAGQAPPPGRPIARGRGVRPKQPSTQIPWTQRPLLQKPPTRSPWTQTPLTWEPGAAIGKALARLPRPGRVAAARREMEEAVPEVIDVLRATVGAGINPRRALQAAAEGAPSALEAVLAQAIRAAELGSGAGAGLTAAAKAEGLQELVLAGEALDLAETTGAPPGPVLSGVATAAADRVRSRQARMAATAEARLSARVVAGMAPAFLGVLALTSPSDAAFLVREPLGWATLAAAAVLELLGISWASRIVRGPNP